MLIYTLHKKAEVVIFCGLYAEKVITIKMNQRL